MKIPTSLEIKRYHEKLNCFHEGATKDTRRGAQPINDGLAAVEERFGLRACDQFERWLYGIVPKP